MIFFQLYPNSIFNDKDDIYLPASEYYTTDEINIEIQKTPENIILQKGPMPLPLFLSLYFELYIKNSGSTRIKTAIKKIAGIISSNPIL